MAGITPPVKVTVEPPAVAMTVPPTQVVVALGVGAMTTPVGNVSLSCAVMVASVLFGLFKVMVRIETPPGGIVDGVKDLLTVGAVLTVNVATAGRELFPLLVTNAPTGNVFV